MKYYGKEKCRILKEIRAEIARENDIEWVVSECKHQGNCKGTCPKCEQEVRELEEALARREALGKKVAVVGISASIALSVTGCINPFPQEDGEVLQGDVPLPDTTAEETYVAIEGEMLPPDSECPVVDEDTLAPGETPESDWEATAGAPVEYEDTETTEETTAPEIVDIMGEPAE